MSKTIKGYKAYDKGLVCKGFQYEVGNEYSQDNKPDICNSGFHFCENPLDVLNYYNLCDSEFTEVEALGNIDKSKEKNSDSKLATDKIKIRAKLDLSAFVKASFEFLWEKCNKKEKSEEDFEQLASSGNYSQLASSGYNSKLAIDGENSVGANIGIDGIIKGKKGNWITLAEYKYDDKKNVYKIIYVLSAQIDGNKIKEDTWYKLSNKKFVEFK